MTPTKSSKYGLGFRREKRQSAGYCDGEQDEECHDRPSDDHRLGDRDRPNVEERHGLQRRVVHRSAPKRHTIKGRVTRNARPPLSRAAKPSRASKVSTTTATAMRPICTAMALPVDPVVKSR